MGLSWVVHSLITIVFGHEDEQHPVLTHATKDNINNMNNTNINKKSSCSEYFQMPLHYPRYNKEEYEKMEEWKVDVLLREYGLMNSFGEGNCVSLDEKRSFVMGAFLWPDQI